MRGHACDMRCGDATAVEGAISQLATEVERHLSDGRRGEILRSGLQVAILGAPNAGKSSLLNILCESLPAQTSCHSQCLGQLGCMKCVCVHAHIVVCI